MKNPTMNQYLNGLDNSSWLQHIKAVLDAAVFIARVGIYFVIFEDMYILDFEGY
jgi:hypothetical protein